MDRLNSEFNPKLLEEKIREMIRCLYGKDFVHRIVVGYDGESYQLRLYVHDNFWCPIVMSTLTDNEDTFLEYIRKELFDRLLIKSDYLKVLLKDGRNESEERLR